MRNMMSRLSRAAAMTVAGVVVASGAAVAVAPSAFASECHLHGAICGGVKNRTGRTMYIARHLGQGSGWFAVWNWRDVPLEYPNRVHCDQQPVGNGAWGGYFSDDDIDGFTFNSEGYHERFGHIGTWHWRQKGVWTKVPDAFSADCGIGDSNEVWCTVTGPGAG